MKKFKYKGFYIVLILFLLVTMLIATASMVSGNYDDGFLAESGVYDLVGESTNNHTNAIYLWQYDGDIFVAISTSLFDHQYYGVEINEEEPVEEYWRDTLTVLDKDDQTKIIIDKELPPQKSNRTHRWLIARFDIEIAETFSLDLYSPGGFALRDVVYTVQGALNVFHEYPPDDPFQDFDQSQPSNTPGGLDAGVYTVHPEDPTSEEGYEYSSVSVTVDSNGAELTLNVNAGETDTGGFTEGSVAVDEEGKVTVNLTEVCAKIINVKYLYELSDYEVSLSVAPEGSGEVTGAGTYNFGDPVTVVATPNEGWAFVNWTDDDAGDDEVSTEASYGFSMPSNDVNLTANFVKIGYEVSLSVEPSGSGTVTGAGTYNFGDPVTVEATPNEGWAFVNWTDDDDGGAEVSTEASYDFSMPSNDVNLTANFEEIPDDCDCDWIGQTAWADGPRYTPRGNWATYTHYVPGSSVTLYAGQTMPAGTVEFSAVDNGNITITITLNPGWRFEDVSENVKIQDYSAAPSGNPAPGRFAHKADATGSPFTIIVPANNVYGVHVNVEWSNCVCD